MPNTTISPNMSLPIPAVSVDPGPQWASDNNSCLTLIDQHDHSSGSGVQITPAGININADLSLKNNNLTTARSLRLTSQSAPISGASDLDCLYASGVDLYYNDGNGNQVRITQSGGVAGSPGSIANLTSPASASYVSASSTFVFESDASTAANIDGGSFIFRNITASSNGITMSAPNALASNYTLTLPTLPASQKFMTLDNSGNISAPWAPDNSTLEINSNSLRIKPAGITATQMSSNINLPGTAVTIGGQQAVVANSSTPTTNLAIIRGSVGAAGNPYDGEGATAAKIATGNYTVSWSPAFSFNAVAVVCPTFPSGTPVTFNLSAMTYSVTASSFNVVISNPGGSPVDSAFSFIVVGTR